MVCALIQTGEVSLTRWIPYIPCRGQYAQSKQRRIQRWLYNKHINIHRLYNPFNEPEYTYLEAHTEAER